MNDIKSIFLLSVKSLFASLPLSIILMMIYATCIGVATFIERDFGTVVANDVIYRSWWFSVLNIWILLNMLGGMYHSFKFGRFKIGFQILHLSFVVIIIGASITRIYGFEGVMQIENKQSSSFFVSSEKYLNVFINDGEEFDPLNAFKKAYSFNLSPYTRSEVHIKDKAFNDDLEIHSLKVINYSTQNALNQEDLKSKRKENLYIGQIKVSYNNQIKVLNVLNNGQKVDFVLNGRQFVVSWDYKQVKLPFTLYLDKFQVETYPGSNMPSSYASFVNIKDGDKSLDYKIYMNHTLDYGGFRFFQSSYTTEMGNNNELIYTGTVLSVNNDPGKFTTYLGYTLLIIGAIFILFDKKSRFIKLSNFIKSQKLVSIALVFVLPLVLISKMHADTSLQNQDLDSKSIDLGEDAQKQILHLMQNINKRWEVLNTTMNDSSDKAVLKRVDNLKKIPKKYIQMFKTLQIQNSIGRLESMDTFSNDLMRKITKSDNLDGLKPNQFLIGLMTMPQDMRKLRIIYVQNKEIRELLGVKGKYISLNDIFDLDKLKEAKSSNDVLTKSYKIYNFVESANKKKESERNQFDKDILKLNEQVNYVFPDAIWYYLKIFPDNGSEFWKVSTSDGELNSKNEIIASSIRGFLINEFLMGIAQNDYSNLTFVLDSLHKYQKENASSFYLSDNHIYVENLINKINIFPISQYIYLLLGIILFIIALIAILRNKKINTLLRISMYSILLIVFLTHTAGLIFRWYIGGHAPWSNAYESMLYIGWASALSGIVILRKSVLALCGASFLAGMTLMVAHWGFMDPQIGNLVPVLKSYWLNIHVSVIVASYGFLGLSLMLGLINIILFILRSTKRPQVDSSIISLSVINEMSMIIGILMLTIGTFLGGVWANESWGRYWSWDSKETWSLVSIGIYACVLHIRLLRFKDYLYYFNVLSIVAFCSILMTYFGVNYYLSGMHSYGKGDADILDPKMYITSGIILALIIIAFFKKRLDMISI